MKDLHALASNIAARFSPEFEEGDDEGCGARKVENRKEGGKEVGAEASPRLIRAQPKRDGDSETIHAQLNDVPELDESSASMTVEEYMDVYDRLTQAAAKAASKAIKAGHGVGFTFPPHMAASITAEKLTKAAAAAAAAAAMQGPEAMADTTAHIMGTTPRAAHPMSRRSSIVAAAAVAAAIEEAEHEAAVGASASDSAQKVEDTMTPNRLTQAALKTAAIAVKNGHGVGYTFPPRTLMAPNKWAQSVAPSAQSLALQGPKPTDILRTDQPTTTDSGEETKQQHFDLETEHEPEPETAPTIAATVLHSQINEAARTAQDEAALKAKNELQMLEQAAAEEAAKIRREAAELAEQARLEAAHELQMIQQNAEKANREQVEAKQKATNDLQMLEQAAAEEAAKIRRDAAELAEQVRMEAAHELQMIQQNAEKANREQVEAALKATNELQMLEQAAAEEAAKIRREAAELAEQARLAAAHELQTIQRDAEKANREQQEKMDRIVQDNAKRAASEAGAMQAAAEARGQAEAELAKLQADAQAALAAKQQFEVDALAEHARAAAESKATLAKEAKELADAAKLAANEEITRMKAEAAVVLEEQKWADQKAREIMEREAAATKRHFEEEAIAARLQLEAELAQMRQIALEQKRQLDQQGDEGRGRVVAEVEAMRLAEEARLKAEADLALVQAQVQAAVEQQQLERERLAAIEAEGRVAMQDAAKQAEVAQQQADAQANQILADADAALQEKTRLAEEAAWTIEENAAAAQIALAKGAAEKEAAAAELITHAIKTAEFRSELEPGTIVASPEAESLVPQNSSELALAQSPSTPAVAFRSQRRPHIKMHTPGETGTGLPSSVAPQSRRNIAADAEVRAQMTAAQPDGNAQGAIPVIPARKKRIHKTRYMVKGVSKRWDERGGGRMKCALHFNRRFEQCPTCSTLCAKHREDVADCPKCNEGLKSLCKMHLAVRVACVGCGLPLEQPPKKK